MHRCLKPACLTLALAVSLPALADHRDSGYDRDGNFMWARVVSVDPIVARTSDPETHQVCWDQPVTYYQPGRTYPTYRRDPTTGTLIGALVGGALGNQVGKGDGRKAATVAGALIGGKVGHDVAANSDERDAGRMRRDYEQVCEERTTRDVRQDVVGYDVAYELEGEVFHTRTDAHPGDQIRVRVVPWED